MQPSPRQRAAEARFRQLLTDADLAEPDRVEYATEELTFFWEESTVAVVVERDDAARRRSKQRH